MNTLVGVPYNPEAELTFDQRGPGFPRILDGDGNGIATVDIGAFESHARVTVSGQVSSNGSNLAGVSIGLSGSATNTAETDSSGNYSFVVDAGGNYTITPSLTNYVFTPANSTFNNLSANQTANFVRTNTCSYVISPTSASAKSSGKTGSISVTAEPSCSWTAVSNAGWLSVIAANSGSGNGTVNYAVEANEGAARTGTITIGSQTFTINQAAFSLSISGKVTCAITTANQPQSR